MRGFAGETQVKEFVNFFLFNKKKKWRGLLIKRLGVEGVQSNYFFIFPYAKLEAAPSALY